MTTDTDKLIEWLLHDAETWPAFCQPNCVLAAKRLAELQAREACLIRTMARGLTRLDMAQLAMTGFMP